MYRVGCLPIWARLSIKTVAQSHLAFGYLSFGGRGAGFQALQLGRDIAAATVSLLGKETANARTATV